MMTRLLSTVAIVILLVPKTVLAQADPVQNPNANNPEPVSETLNTLNTEIIGLDDNLTTINGIIGTLLPILMTLAGLILLFMLISGGFTMMTAVSDPKAADAGKQRITIAITGFLLLFASYWIAQILEIVLGVTILG